MKKYLITAAVIFSLLFSVSAANAQTTNNSELIKSLLAQLASLQQQLAILLKAQQGTTSACHMFNVDLKSGDQAEEVTKLAGVLVAEGFLIKDEVFQDGRTRLLFDKSIIAAVIKFQAKYGIPQTGNVGPLTRGKLNALYGNCGNALGAGVPNQSSVYAQSIEIIGGQSAYAAGQPLKFSVRATSSYGANANPSAGFTLYVGISNPQNEIVKVNGIQQHGIATYNPNTALWEVGMMAPTDASVAYTADIGLFCSDNKLCMEKQVEKTFSFTVSGGYPAGSGTVVPASSITVIYPQTGVVLDNSGTKNSGMIANIQWNSSGLGNSGVDINLIRTNGTVKVLAANVPNSGNFSWLYDPSLPNNFYKIQILPHEKDAPVGTSGFFEIALGNNYFQ